MPSSPDASISGKGFLRHFEACNRRDMSKFVPFEISGQPLGWLLKDIAALLAQKTTHFVSSGTGLALHPRYDSFEARTQALGEATDILIAHHGIGLRREMYPVIRNWGDAPLAQIDRTAVPLFGIKGFGIHVNGYVRKPDGIYLWIGERAADRLVDPGKLDNMIGGGQPIGLSIQENLCKEAEEEAGFTPEIATKAVQVPSMTYMVERHHGLRNDVLFLFDLELPADIVPRNTDGEVAAFHLMPLADVAALVHDTNRFKFNCNLVIADFLIRHGHLTSAHPEYQALRAYIDTPASAST